MEFDVDIESRKTRVLLELQRNRLQINVYFYLCLYWTLDYLQLVNEASQILLSSRSRFIISLNNIHLSRSQRGNEIVCNVKTLMVEEMIMYAILQTAIN